MTKSVLSFVVMLLIVTVGCSSDDDIVSQNEPEVAFPEIVGTWEWVGTVNGLDDTTDTPEVSGITRDIVISDTEFIFYLGENILAQRSYEYSIEVSELTGLNEFMVTFDDNGFRDIIRRDDNFINFIDDCEDCYTSIYKVKN